MTYRTAVITSYIVEIGGGLYEYRSGEAIRWKHAINGSVSSTKYIVR